MTDVAVRPKQSGRLNLANIQPNDIQNLAQLPYVEAMEVLFNLTGISHSKSRYFSPIKIDLWPIMPFQWRIAETVNFIEKENNYIEQM